MNDYDDVIYFTLIMYKGNSAEIEVFLSPEELADYVVRKFGGGLAALHNYTVLVNGLPWSQWHDYMNSEGPCPHDMIEQIIDAKLQLVELGCNVERYIG